VTPLHTQVGSDVGASEGSEVGTPVGLAVEGTAVLGDRVGLPGVAVGRGWGSGEGT